MLSNHEFVTAVRDEIYLDVVKLEKKCLELFNKQYVPGRGPTGFYGNNEVAFTIQLLLSSASLLKRIAIEQKINLPENI